MVTLGEEITYAGHEINLLCQRLCREGVSMDAVNACLLEQAAIGMANGEHAELMPRVFRETADQMEAGEYKLATVDIGKRPRPILTVIKGGGGGLKVFGRLRLSTRVPPIRRFFFRCTKLFGLFRH